MAIKEKPGCFSIIVGACVLWALPGVVLDECSRERLVPRVQEVQERLERYQDVRRVDPAPKAIPGAPEEVEEVEWRDDYREEVKRRVKEGAPWILR